MTLCEVAETHPRAYAAYTKGFRSKFTYFMRTIKGIDEFFGPVDDVISHQFIPNLFGSDIHLPGLRDVIGLNASDVRLGFPDLTNEAKVNLGSSIKVTFPLATSILNQEDTIQHKCPAGNS